MKMKTITAALSLLLVMSCAHAGSMKEVYRLKLHDLDYKGEQFIQDMVQFYEDTEGKGSAKHIVPAIHEGFDESKKEGRIAGRDLNMSCLYSQSLHVKELEANYDGVKKNLDTLGKKDPKIREGAPAFLSLLREGIKIRSDLFVNSCMFARPEKEEAQ